MGLWWSEMRDKIFPGVPLLYGYGLRGKRRVSPLTACSILPESVALRCGGGLYRLLAFMCGGEQLVKPAIAMQAAQQWVREQIGVGAVVQLNRCLEHVESGISLVAVGVNRPLIIRGLGVRV